MSDDQISPTQGADARPVAIPTLWEAFEMGFSFRTAILGHVLDGRDVRRLCVCDFWHPSMLKMHEGADLHVGLSVNEAIVELKGEVKRRFDAMDATRDAEASDVQDAARYRYLRDKCSPMEAKHLLEHSPIDCDARIDHLIAATAPREKT